MHNPASLLLPLLLLFLTASCKEKTNKSTLFERLTPESTGIYFTNEIREDKNLNILTFEYFYNGAGVGVADFNRDGLQDLFFSSNMGTSRLYLNKGDFTFQDITGSSGINTAGKWASGVCIVDINQDSLPDIYLCFAGPHPAEKRANALYLNNGNNTFTDKAAAYGLADTGHSVQAVFFDYDKDEDLDLYLLTNITDETGPNVIRPKRNNGEMPNTDRLYRNNGNLTFANVSREAGITHEGYGLGVAIADLTEDGWPDIFVSNDYLSNDLLYINNRNGTFTDRASTAFKHTSYSAMGNDIGDFNNDGRPDIVEVDMLPPDNYRKKLMLGATNHDRYRSELQYGYDPQIMRNTLQLNRGSGIDSLPSFSEIACLSGIQATDWSWSPLFADLDNDGWKDLVITNGYPRDITNRDFISYRAQELMQETARENRADKQFAALQNLDGALLNNFIFQNRKDLTFKDVSAEWGFTEKEYATGAAYADLDNDGDLDMVIVNTGSPAGIYRNNTGSIHQNHYITVSLAGPAGNIMGYGARIQLYAKELRQYQEQYPVRGYQSTVEAALHFGLGKNTNVDSLVVTWPDGNITQLHNIPADQKILVSYASAKPAAMPPASEKEITFQPANHAYNIHYRHKETSYTDFNIQPLLPHKFSQSGPGIAVADINGDGHDDFFVGGAYHQSGELFFQQANGSFKALPLEAARKPEEDMGVLFFDSDNDKDPDLYIVSGGNEYVAGSKYYQDRFYINDGHGRFKRDTTALPVEQASGSCVVASDYDADGDLDLFVGGKLTPQHYPEGGQSMLLENNGGRFTDVTDKKAPGLKNIGMVNAAVWSDVNNDQRPDLVLAGEWMPVTLFLNEEQQFRNATAQLGLSGTVGWWNSIQPGDFDQDGKTDFILGNLGTNSRYTTSPAAPLSIFTYDFGDIGNRNPIIAFQENGINIPIHPRDDIMAQLPGLKKKFLLYADYAKASITDLFPAGLLQKAVPVTANTFHTAILRNNGTQPWQLTPLCTEAQFAPVFGIVVNDFTADGIEDVLLTGNFYGAEVINGQYDAFKGLLLQGKEKGGFITRDDLFRVEGDAKGLAEIMVRGNTPLILAALNNDSLSALEFRHKKRIKMRKVDNDAAYAIIATENGQSLKHEFYYGSGYLSATGRYLHIPSNARLVEIYNYKGKKQSYHFETSGSIRVK